MKDSDAYVKRNLTKEELSFFETWSKKNLSPIKKYINFSEGWIVVKADVNDNPQEVVVIPFLDNKKYYQLIKDKSDDDYWGYVFEKEKHLYPVVQAIEHWKLKQSLNPSTVKTFSELIDEL